MEKQVNNSMNKILKFLPKAASVVHFQNHPFSPNRDRRLDNNYCHRLKAHVGKGFSGSIIPDEVRRKHKNGSFETQEPTSPKVSCMGQIKHKKKMVANKTKTKPPSLPQEPKSKAAAVSVSSPRDVEKNQSSSSKLKRLFSSSTKPVAGRRSDASVYGRQPLSADRVPNLGQMKRFASGHRDNFASFDWTTQITPVDSENRDCYDCNSDEDDGMYCGQGEDDEVIIPFSAPIIMAGGCSGEGLRPRKEVNLWKRRTMNPPKPLQLT